MLPGGEVNWAAGGQAHVLASRKSVVGRGGSMATVICCRRDGRAHVGNSEFIRAQGNLSAASPIRKLCKETFRNARTAHL